MFLLLESNMFELNQLNQFILLKYHEIDAIS